MLRTCSRCLEPSPSRGNHPFPVGWNRRLQCFTVTSTLAGGRADQDGKGVGTRVRTHGADHTCAADRQRLADGLPDPRQQLREIDPRRGPWRRMRLLWRRHGLASAIPGVFAIRELRRGDRQGTRQPRQLRRGHEPPAAQFHRAELADGDPPVGRAPGDAESGRGILNGVGAAGKSVGVCHDVPVCPACRSAQRSAAHAREGAPV